MRQIHDGHVAVPGMAVVEVAPADDEKAFAILPLRLGVRHKPYGHEAGAPGVRLRCPLACARN